MLSISNLFGDIIGIIIGIIHAFHHLAGPVIDSGSVLDTNVLVSGMFTGNSSSPTRQILDLTLEGTILPLISKEIVNEYNEVLSRDKFPFKPEDVSFVVDAFKSLGMDPGRTAAKDVDFPDPKEPIVVTPAQMLEIIHNAQKGEE